MYEWDTLFSSSLALYIHIQWPVIFVTCATSPLLSSMLAFDMNCCFWTALAMIGVWLHVHAWPRWWIKVHNIYTANMDPILSWTTAAEWCVHCVPSFEAHAHTGYAFLVHPTRRHPNKVRHTCATRSPWNCALCKEWGKNIVDRTDLTD